MFLANLFIFSVVSLKRHWPYLVAIGISEQLPLWLTPYYPCMTFDPSNALHSGQGLFVPNLVGIEHF